MGLGRVSGQAVAQPDSISGGNNICTASNGQRLGSRMTLARLVCASRARLLCSSSVPEHGQPDLALL